MVDRENRRDDPRLPGGDGSEGEELRPVDFSALGAPLTAARFDVAVAHAAGAGARELARRRGGAGVARIVVAWRRPVLAMSALAAAAALVLLARPAGRVRATAADATAERGGTIAEALGVPAAYAESVEGKWAVVPGDARAKP